MAAGSGRQIGSDYATAIEPGRLMRPGTNDVENLTWVRRLPLTNPMHASACRRCTLQSCRSVLGHVATPTAPKSNVMSNGEDCGGWTSALNRIGSSLCSSHAVPSACRVSVPAAAAEIIRAVRHPVAATITRLMVRSRNLTS